MTDNPKTIVAGYPPGGVSPNPFSLRAWQKKSMKTILTTVLSYIRMQVIIAPYFPTGSNADSGFLKQKAVVTPRDLFKRLLNSRATIGLHASRQGPRQGPPKMETKFKLENESKN